MMTNTRDLSDMGYRELDMAGDLLKAYKGNNDNTEYFTGNGATVEFNPNSGKVFLVDEDCNVAIMNGDNLEDWFNCPYCGHEGFKEDMEHEPKDKDCTEYLESIGVLEAEEAK